MKYLAVIIALSGCRHYMPEQKAEREYWRADLRAHREAWAELERKTP